MASAGKDAALDIGQKEGPGPDRRESKRQKFRPFSAVRKLFSGGKSKRKITGDDEGTHAASAAKDRPTSALVSDSPGEDRLGADRSLGDNHNKPADTMISLERQNVAGLQAQKSSVLSNPNLPRSAFKTELASKLNKRRSMCSEDDEEDGTSQGHDANSLTGTVNGGEAIEDVQEDLFHSQWTSSVSSASSSRKTGIDSQETQSSLDLSDMARTELLKSDAAKDRISVNRSRKTNRQSRKRSGGRYSSLPSLAEVETGLSLLPTSLPAGRPRSEYIAPTVLSDFDLHMTPSAASAVKMASSESTDPSTLTSATQLPLSTVTTSSSEASAVVQSSKRDPQKEGNHSSAPLPSQNPRTHRVSFAVEKGEPESGPTLNAATGAIAASPTVSLPPEKETEVKVTNVRETQDVGAGSRTVVASSLETKTHTTVGPSPSSRAPEPSPASAPAGRREGLRQTDSQSEDAFSPKPDYKLRRQERSKTLPVQYAVVTVQRTASQRGGASPNRVQRHGQEQGQTPKSDEPEWVALSRRKCQKHNEESQLSAASASTPGKQTSDSSPPSSITPTPTFPTRTAAVTSSTVTTRAPYKPPSSMTVEPSKKITMSSPAEGLEATKQNQAGERWNQREGGVKTPSNNAVFVNRVSSVKVTSTGKEPALNLPSPSSPSPVPHCVPSTSPSKATPVTVVSGEPRTSQTTFINGLHSRQAQSTRTQPTFLRSTSSTTSLSPTKTTQPFSIASAQSSSRLPTAGTANADARSRLSGQRTSTPRPQSQVEKKSGAPAWQTEVIHRTLGASDVKIELVENKPSSTLPMAKGKATDGSGQRRESKNKGGEDVTGVRSEDSPSTKRHSRVLDLLKNFENLQGVS